MLSIGKILGNMAHMSNMFSHRLLRKVGLFGTLNGKIWEGKITWLFHYNVVNQHRGWLSLHGAYFRPANQ